VRLTIIQDQLRVGGTERQSLHLARASVEEGHEVHLIIFRPGGELFPQQRAKDYTVTVLQSWDSGISVYAPGLIEAIEASHPERILCMGRSANCYAGWIQQQFRCTPVVSTLRTGKRLQPWHRWALSRVSGILVNTGWWAQRLKIQNCLGEAIEVVPNALLSDQAPSEEGEALRHTEGVDSSTTVLLQVASFRHGKRQATLIRQLANWDAEAEDRSWVFWLVGDGPCRTECEVLAKSLGLESKLRFFGYIENPAAHYAAADLALSLSREDSLPNFLIEAQSSGLPVIAEDFRGVGEAFEPGIGGFLIPPGDLLGFRKALSTLVENRSLRESMGRAACRWSRSRFSPLQQARAVLGFLDRL
jgi:glycosyltransferase involved in cell wall biosynthesis|tara:strand:+ start:1790 stop:2869 length:1080 start_codon:yes stop_codon:yes gene_type:complete